MKPKTPVTVTGETQNIPTTYFFPCLTKEYYAELGVPLPVRKDELPRIDALTFFKENTGLAAENLLLRSYLGDTEFGEFDSEQGGLGWSFPAIYLKMKTQILSPDGRFQIFIPSSKELETLALANDAPEYMEMRGLIYNLKALLAQNTQIFLPTILSEFENKGFKIDPEKLYMNERDATIFSCNSLEEKFPQMALARFPIYPDKYTIEDCEGYFLETLHEYRIRF